MSEQAEQQSQEKRDKFRHEIYKYLTRHADLMTHAVTLTFDGRKLSAARRKADWMEQEQYEAVVQRSFKHFVNRINRSVYGNAAQRYGKTLLIMPVIQGLKHDETPHYHCAIGAPERLQFGEFACMVKECWSSVAFAGHHVDVQPYRSEGWLSYISREAVSLKRTNVDWDNVMLPVHLLAHC